MATQGGEKASQEKAAGNAAFKVNYCPSRVFRVAQNI